MLRLANARLEVDIDPERGADILVVRRPGGPNVLATYDWQTPLRASRSAGYGDLATDWLSEYRGAWQELFPNAGAACEVMGVPLPFHGEVSTARWDVTGLTGDAVTLTTPTRLPLILERRMRLAPDDSTLLIEETASLDADIGVPFLWGHHPAFAATAGARIDMPRGISVMVDDGYAPEHVDLLAGSTGAWPYVPGRAGGMVDVAEVGQGPTERLMYLSGFGANGGWAAIRGIADGLGVAMAWDAVTYPHAWFWWEDPGPRASMARPIQDHGHRAAHGGPVRWAGRSGRPGRRPPAGAGSDTSDLADGQPVRCRRPSGPDGGEGRQRDQVIHRW